MLQIYPDFASLQSGGGLIVACGKVCKPIGAFNVYEKVGETHPWRPFSQEESISAAQLDLTSRVDRNLDVTFRALEIETEKRLIKSRLMQPNLLSSVPVLHVSSSAAAEEFYCQRLGFIRRWAWRPGPGEEPGFIGLERDGVPLHISSFSGDGVSGCAVSFFVKNVDALFAEFSARGVRVELEPCDQTWGNREMYVRDPDNNSLRFIQPNRKPEQ
jgi:uncharacterized glyoxalase superfamily protein PhnB